MLEQTSAGGVGFKLRGLRVPVMKSQRADFKNFYTRSLKSRAAEQAKKGKAWNSPGKMLTDQSYQDVTKGLFNIVISNSHY